MRICLPEELSWLCPVDVPMPVRLGGLMDGGYIVPQIALDRSQGLLSFGLGDDFTFDQDWHRLKPTDPIHMYDASVTGESIHIRINPSVRKHIDIRQEYRDFFQGDRRHYLEYIGKDNFASALERIGVDQVFIKMDIEGAEYGLIDIILEHRNRITGIAMEWHSCTNRNQRWAAEVKKLNQYYAITHMHGNNHVSQDSDGIFGCMELTHLRRDLVTTTNLRRDIYLPGLDHSNVHGWGDVEYYFD